MSTARGDPRIAHVRLAKKRGAPEVGAEVVHKMAQLSKTPFLVWPRRISPQPRKR